MGPELHSPRPAPQQPDLKQRGYPPVAFMWENRGLALFDVWVLVNFLTYYLFNVLANSSVEYSFSGVACFFFRVTSVLAKKKLTSL